jgi:type 1 glutamine amidotransferase
LPKTRVLLLMGGPEYHNKPLHYAELAGILAGEGKADLRITDDLDILTSSSLTDYQVIANYSTYLLPSEEQARALLGAVEAGAGFLGLHAAAATFWNSAPYLTMLGSRFLRHGPFRKFTVTIVDRAHPITAGIEDFAVDDELYEVGGKISDFAAVAAAISRGRPRSELGQLGDGPLQPDTHLLASAEGHPMLYVKSFGRGRVHYNALGHDNLALGHPSYRRLLLQGLAWVTGQT